MPGAHTSKVNDNMRRRHVKRAYAENLVNEFLDLRNEMGTELVDVIISEKSRRVPLEKVEKAIKSANSGIAEMKRLTAQVSTHEPTTRTKSTISAINSKAPQLQTQQHQTTPQPQVIDSLMKAEIKITADSTEEQVLQEFRVVMADFAEHRRQKTLEIANRAVCGVESNYKSSNWGTQPTLNQEIRTLENSPPKKVEKRLQELKHTIERYKRFPELYAEKVEADLPCNWRQKYANVAEATKDRMESDKLETVAKAVEFYMELVEAAQEILNRKKSFINEHAPEVPSLIRKATRLRQTAARLQRQVFELLRKAPSGLREKQVKKLVSVILKHKSLEKQHNAVAAQLAQYNPDNPYNGMQPFPSTNYRLPSFIRTKLQQAEQVEQREVKKINEFQGLAA